LSKPPPHIPTLGILELASIARGLVVSDAILKKASVRLLRAAPVGSGKFLVILTGPEGDLLEAVEEGRGAGDLHLVGWTCIPNIHPQVVRALARQAPPRISLDAVGVLESSSLAALVQAADASLKMAAVELLELTYDLDLGGKGFLTLSGPLAEVEAALETGRQTLENLGAHVLHEIIPRPHEGLREVLLEGGSTCFWRG
jgi:microcompartment protein CcmL/EutN